MKTCVKISSIIKKWMISILFVLCGLTMSAQIATPLEKMNVIDTIQNSVSDTLVEVERIAGNDRQVITNLFKDNWFALADVGINAYYGDYTYGNLSTRLTPQFNVGFGKWFEPGFGAKVQFTGFSSKEYKTVETINTRNSQTYYDENGNPYWTESIKWCGISANLMFNISRMIFGYEGIGSSKRKNQIIASIGLGATHHYDIPLISNIVSGHMELQYSRFFFDKKALSLDVRLRGIFYGTDFDRVNRTFIDQNISLNVGLTYYFKERGWNRTVSNITYYHENHTIVNQYSVAAPVVAAPEITFPYLVNFVIDKVEVVNRERVNLKVVADMMKATPEQKYIICGYADKHTGTVRRNIWLAEHRAKNVYRILTEEFGVPKSQLILDDKGGVENMFYDDPQLSRSAIISKYEEDNSENPIEDIPNE